MHSSSKLRPCTRQCCSGGCRSRRGLRRTDCSWGEPSPGPRCHRQRTPSWLYSFYMISHTVKNMSKTTLSNIYNWNEKFIHRRTEGNLTKKKNLLLKLRRKLFFSMSKIVFNLFELHLALRLYTVHNALQYAKNLIVHLT